MINHFVLLISMILFLMTGLFPVWAGEINDQISQKVHQKKLKILLPEGFQISGRAAKLILHPTDQRWFLQFEPKHSGLGKLSANQTSSDSLEPIDPNSNDPFALPIEVLPCQWLTKMVSVTNKKTDLSVTFRVWAEVTTYQNKNYILPKDVYTLSLFGSKPDRSELRVPRSAILRPKPGLKGEPMASEDQFQLPGKLRQVLMDSSRTEPILIGKMEGVSDSSKTSAPRRSFTVGGTTRSDLRENHMVINRVGRIAYDPDKRMWLFAFEADGQSLTEPPIALLPSQLLEIMENTLQETSRPAKFRLSGQVTRYQNKNYLLLRKLLIVLDRGNLDK
jgi:hypothetical protein